MELVPRKGQNLFLSPFFLARDTYLSGSGAMLDLIVSDALTPVLSVFVVVVSACLCVSVSM